MKNQTIQPSILRRKAIWFAGSLIALIAAGAAFWSSSAAARANDPEPIIAILTPHDGASLNAASLRVQALVAAVKSRNGESFVFNGQTVAGRNAGRVRRVDLALDGIVLRSIDTSGYGRQFVTDFVVDLSAINEGLHLLTISAMQGNGNNETTKSVSTTFTINRSLVLAERNRIEEAATPKPFAGFRVRGWDGQDDDDADEEEPWHCPPRFDLKGTIMLGTQSNGIDLATDRTVVALGSQTKVLEPGMLNCNRQEKICRFEDASQPFVRFIELKRKNDGRWKYRLRGTGPLPGAGGSTLSLRVGNDWGSIDLATGERIASLRPHLDVGHQAQALIGAAGGTVETVDAASVVIRLQIPEGALTQDTIVKVTPLLSSPLSDSSAALRPGVKFEPEGLQFAEAATLTMDFSNTSQTLGDEHSIFLLTSPLTTLPLYGTTDAASRTLTARLHHFSAAGPGRGNNRQMDLRAWAASILLGTSNLSIRELELLAAMVVQEQRQGCTQNCLDMALLTRRVSDSIGALVSATCPASVSNPTDQALQRLLLLETLGQGMGVDTAALGLRTCLEQVFRALIEQHGIQAMINPSPTNLARLLNDASKAQLLGFSNLDTLALQKLAAALRALMAHGQQLCPSDRPAALAVFSMVQQYAPAVVGVDPALASDVQSAITNCGQTGGGNDIRVRINYVSIQGFVPPCSEEIDCGHRSEAVEATLPLTLGVPGFTVTVSEPQPNVVAIDATATTTGACASPDEIGSVCPDLLQASLEIVPTRPGSLSTVSNFRQWTRSSPGGCYQTSTFQLDPNAPNVHTILVSLNKEGGFCNDGGLGALNGGGRLATITFTPSP